MGLAGALGPERAVIAGHDWGGLLMWTMARQYPADRRSDRLNLPSGATADAARCVPPHALARPSFYLVQFRTAVSRVGVHMGRPSATTSST
jgi:pimeloyl-ACP methyl ester carboxylesterase